MTWGKLPRSFGQCATNSITYFWLPSVVVQVEKLPTRRRPISVSRIK